MSVAARLLPSGFFGAVATSTICKRLVLGAGALLLVPLLLNTPGSDEPAVELAAGLLAHAAAAQTAPVPAQELGTAPPPDSPAADPAALSGIVLKGISGGPAGGAAIFETANGAQRVIRVGRDIVPGMVLRAVGVHHAVAGAGSGDIRLELDKAGGVALTASSPPPASRQPASGAHSNRRATMGYRLGLQPVRSNGRVSGYTIKPGAQLPHLQSAGLRSGDVITAVNGSSFDEERLMELAWQIDNSERVNLEFLRGGKRMTVALNPQ